MTSSKKLKRNDSDLEFSKIHVPKMRSVFWKYFGFPANENDEIITKQKVVCTLCHTVLRNHCNTTNIRAHIQSTHKLIFAEIISAHGIQIPPRKVQKKIKLNPAKFDDTHTIITCSERRSLKGKRSAFSPSELHDEDSMNLIEAIPLTYDDTDPVSKDEELLDDGLSNNFLDKSIGEIQSARTQHVINKTKCTAPLNINVDINPIQIPIEYDIEEALRKMIIKDLQNVSSIYGSGMQEFVAGFHTNHILIPPNKMEASIRNIHNEKFIKLKDRLKVHSQVKLYSLSFDVWLNIEGKQFVSIYFNNISEEFENQFCDNLYMTIQLNDYTVFELIFEDFNLENCSAAVINFNHEILNTFLSNNDIPIVYCFSYIVNTCINEVFQIPEVSNTFDEVQDIIARYGSEICSEDVEIPTVCNEFPITKLVLFKFFCESVSWPEEMQALISKVKNILDTIAPLEVTMDTLREEDIPLSSLFLPFADKIIEKHFVINDCDVPLQSDIKAIVVNEFQRSVCSNNYLAVTAMLDPRFHKFLSVKNVSICLNILEKKYSQINKHRWESRQSLIVKQEDESTKPKKSHLKMFFDAYEETPVKNLRRDILIEHDLSRYRDEAFASLEESPLIWWSRWGNSYGSLKYLADAYNCILGFVNMSFKNSLKEQILFHRKRFMLTGNIINEIIFLNKIY